MSQPWNAAWVRKALQMLSPLVVFAVVYRLTAGPPDPPSRFRVAAGQDALVRELLGEGQVFAERCTLMPERVSLKFAGIIMARYQCSGASTLGVELHHPADRPSLKIRTEQFAVETDSHAMPPSALLPAVLAHIRAHESTFRWVEAPP